MNIKDDVKAWSKETGIYPIEQPELSLEYLMKIVSEGVGSIEVNKLIEVMTRVSAYNIYLKSVKCSVNAQLIIKQGEYHKLLSEILMQLIANEPDLKFKTKEDKEFLAIRTNGDLGSLQQEMTLLKCKAERIKDIPYSVDKMIDNLKLVVSRKIDGRN